MAQYSDTFHCYTDDFIDRIESNFTLETLIMLT